jgi:hypothetical protein
LIRGGCSAAFTLLPPFLKAETSFADLSDESEEGLFLVAEISETALSSNPHHQGGGASLAELVQVIRTAVSTSVGCQVSLCLKKYLKIKYIYIYIAACYCCVCVLCFGQREMVERCGRRGVNTAHHIFNNIKQFLTL